MSAALRTVPVVDVRNGGVVRHAHEARVRARALRDDCLGRMPALMPLMPAMDRMARCWFQRSEAPYVADIEAIAATLSFSGLWFLNGSYQWGCTTLAREEAGTPWLARTLDWPFHGLGRSVEVARQCGAAGEFFNVTWPGYVGVLTAMAPGRFAAAINQAPLYRRSEARALRFVDIAANAIHTWRKVRHIPPDQLLRQVFESCGSFADAREQLDTIPVARPVIYTLIGCAGGERCVIERTENGHTTRTDRTAAANDWHDAHPQWEARIGGAKLLWQSFADAAVSSRLRADAISGWNAPLAEGGFAWVKPPVLNRYTRQAVEMSAAAGVLRVIGYERVRGMTLPQPATMPCELTAERAAA
jgi:hypothetical protein